MKTHFIYKQIVIWLIGLFCLSLFVPSNGFSQSQEKEFKVLKLGFKEDEIKVAWYENGTYDAKNNVNEVSPNPLSWTLTKIEGEDATIDGNGIVQFGSGDGIYNIEASFSENPHCEDTMTLFVGGCTEFKNSISFGNFSFILSGPAVANGDPDEEGYCSYDVKASTTFEMPHAKLTIQSKRLDQISLHFEKRESDDAFKNVKFTWSGSETFKVGLLDAQLSNLQLSIDSEKLNGSVDLQVSLNEDVNVKEIVYLKKGVTGKITLNYTNAEKWEGASWNFGGVDNINIELRKQGEILAKATGRLDAEGVLDATMKTGQVVTYNARGFEMEVPVSGILIRFKYDIAESQVRFISGNGNLKVKGITGINGYLELKLTVTEESIIAAVSAEDADAFGMVFSDVALETTFTTEFDFGSIAGSLSAKHDKFDTKFNGIEFEVEEGELKRFGIQSANKRWNNFSVSIADAIYKSNQGLHFNIAMAISGMGNVDIKNFKISESGQITLDKIEGTIDQSPVDVEFSAEFAATYFNGNFDGKFPGGVGIAGTVVVGVEGGTFGFTYMYLKLGVGTNILLGTSGLKVKQIAGEFGYNYNASGSEGGGGTKQQGTHSIGLGLKLSDTAELMLIGGYVRLILGNATSMELIGDVQVTASTPYFSGEMIVGYTFGEDKIQGSLSSTLKIPADGRIISMDTCNLNYKIDSNKWWIDGVMHGQLFNPNITIDGNTDLKAPLSSPISGMRGEFGGSINASLSKDIRYPNDFNPAACDTAKATDNWLGFGFYGRYDLEFSGIIENVYLRDVGIDGRFSVKVDFSGEANVKWPFGCPDAYDMTASGKLTAEQKGSRLNIKGRLMFSGGGESEEADLDITI